VDCRLNRFNEIRLERITKVDLPELARAIVAFQRKQCQVSSGVSRNVSYVRLFGDGVNVIIRGDDWNLILPFLIDGTLDPLLTPLSQIIELYPSVQYDPALQVTRDTEFNSRVLNLLEKLFLVDIPTSNL
jgi:hypothetical protein